MTDQNRAGLVPPRPVETGTERYYLDRLADFRLRCPGASPPSYYADYGNKCLHQFLATKPMLSFRGQTWVDDTLELLQEMMEEERRGDAGRFAALERDDDAFRSIAFGTHSHAYHQAGIMELGARDLWKIVRTPDVADLLSDDGLKEILQLVLGRDNRGGRGLVFDPDLPASGVLATISRSTRRWRKKLRLLARQGP